MKILKKLPFATVVFVFLLVGCAHKQVMPTEDIPKAEMAIKEAMDRGALTISPVELKMAQEELDNAKAAMQKEEFKKARRLAEKAEVDAKVAESKADAVTEQKHAEEMRSSIETLRQEIERAQQSGK